MDVGDEESERWKHEEKTYIIVILSHYSTSALLMEWWGGHLRSIEEGPVEEDLAVYWVKQGWGANCVLWREVMAEGGWGVQSQCLITNGWKGELKNMGVKDVQFQIEKSIKSCQGLNCVGRKILEDDTLNTECFRFWTMAFKQWASSPPPRPPTSGTL